MSNPAPPTRSAPPPAAPAPSRAAAPAPATVDIPEMTVKQPTFAAPRIVLTGVEGIGKTSLVAHAPGAAIIQVGNETGYATLLGAGRAPAIPEAHVTTWEQLLGLMDRLADNPPQVLGIDTAGGAERMCHEYVCKRDYKGEWGETGFTAFQRGYDTSITDWLLFLGKLDRLHRLGTTIILLAHCKVKPFNNPEGDKFDRYVADMHDKTWAATHRWADAALFFKFETIVKKEKNNRTLGIGGDTRMLYTTRTDARDAKNRYGMPPEIEMPSDPSQMWPTLWSYIQPAKG